MYIHGTWQGTGIKAAVSFDWRLAVVLQSLMKGQFTPAPAFPNNTTNTDRGSTTIANKPFFQVTCCFSHHLKQLCGCDGSGITLCFIMCSTHCTCTQQTDDSLVSCWQLTFCPWKNMLCFELCCDVFLCVFFSKHIYWWHLSSILDARCGPQIK